MRRRFPRSSKADSVYNFFSRPTPKERERSGRPPFEKKSLHPSIHPASAASVSFFPGWKERKKERKARPSMNEEDSTSSPAVIVAKIR